MTVNWKDLVAAHRNPQQSSDPQRATLRARAIGQVEEGLRHLASVGLVYDVVPRGVLPVQELEAETPVDTSLTLESAIAQAAIKH